LDKIGHFAGAVANERQPPDRIGARGGNVHTPFVETQNDSVRAGHFVSQEIEPAVCF
jgi:hypothetical protein